MPLGRREVQRIRQAQSVSRKSDERVDLLLQDRDELIATLIKIRDRDVRGNRCSCSNEAFAALKERGYDGPQIYGAFKR